MTHPPTAPASRLLDQPRAVWAVAFACVVAFMGIGLVDPILPALASQLDASPSQVELLFTSYFAFTGVSMLVTGPALRERRDRVVPGRQARRGRLPRGPVPRRRRGGAAGAGDPARRAPPPRRGGVRAGARTAPARDRRGAGRRDRARATRGLSLAARARTGGHRGREGRPFPHSTAHRSNHCAESVAQLTASAQSIRARHRVCGNRRFRSTPSGRKPPPERNPPGRTHPSPPSRSSSPAGGAAVTVLREHRRPGCSRQARTGAADLPRIAESRH